MILAVMLAGLTSGSTFVSSTIIAIEDYGGATKTALRPIILFSTFAALGTLFFEQLMFD